MRKSLKEVRKHIKTYSSAGALFREFILGWQDGLVNVLGVILGIAIATSDAKLVIIAGLAAAFAESFSITAVAYTSAKAEEDFYKSQQKKEFSEIKNIPGMKKKEIYEIYYEKGFRGKLLKDIISRIVSDKKMWLNIMIKDELGLNSQFIHPVKNAVVVGLAAIIGSLIPIITFFFLPISPAIISCLIISAIALFITGAIEGRLTIGHWIKKGLQLMLIGMAAAFIGFIIGKLFGVNA